MAIDDVVVGIDIGSSSLHATVLTPERSVKEFGSFNHFGNPWELLVNLTKGFEDKYSVQGFAFTGTAGNLAKDANGNFFEYETITIPEGVKLVAPDVRYAFHLGAKDPYFFELDPDIIIKPGSGTKCGGGSGILLAKQYMRYFSESFPLDINSDISPEELRSLREQQMDRIIQKAMSEVGRSTQDLEIRGRCGVIITSDMIHKQNEGYHIPDILKAMEKRIGLNFLSDVVKSKKLDRTQPAVMTGGVSANNYIRQVLTEAAGFTQPVQRLPESNVVGAIGTAVLALEHPDKLRPVSSKKIFDLAERRKESISYGPRLSLENVIIYPEPEIRVPEEPVDIIIGIDGGSTTSKAVVIDADTKEVYYKKYLTTSGDPEKAGKKLLTGIRDTLGDKIRTIKGVGFTGSSAGLYEILFTDIRQDVRADMVIDEITCHRKGVKYHHPDVDTIFELGGQDAKFTRIYGEGNVFSKMNLACQAGTGQTLGNIAERYGLDVKTTLQDLAFKAQRVPHVDGTCAVFSEAGVAELAAMNLPQEEVAASMVHAVIGGYVNHFVGNEDIGEHCSAQGGPFKGEAELAMLAQLTGKTIHAFPGREVMGAMGAALAIKDRIDANTELTTAFRGFEVIDINFSRYKSFCSKIHGEDKCKNNDCTVDVYQIGDENVYVGGICPKGNTESSTVARKKDYTKLYKSKLEKALEDFTIGIDEESDKDVLGIPRSMFFLNENAVFLTALYHTLGFALKVSPETNDEMVALATEKSHPENCFPAKIAHGHPIYLNDKVDHMLFINYIGEMLDVPEADLTRLKCCPYSASIGFNTYARVAKDLGLDRSTTLMPVIHTNDPIRTMESRFHEDLERVFPGRFSLEQVAEAVSHAQEKQNEFLEGIYDEGLRFLKTIQNRKEIAYVGIGRGYTMFDSKASADTSSLFAVKGLNFIPGYFFNTESVPVADIIPNMYWKLGRKISQDALFTAEHHNLYPVLMSNFGCGPDSFLMKHLIRELKSAGKPMLELQTDGHSSNTQYGTRILAYNQNINERVEMMKR